MIVIKIIKYTHQNMDVIYLARACVYVFMCVCVYSIVNEPRTMLNKSSQEQIKQKKVQCNQKQALNTTLSRLLLN